MKYIATFLISSVVFAIAYVSLVLTLPPALIPAEYWVREMIVVKRDIVRHYAGQRKIIVASGSHGLFSIDTNLLSRELRIPVINFGLHGSLPLETILSEAGAAVDAGDIVILPLEPPYYCTEEVTDWHLRNAIAWDHERWEAMPIAERVQATGSMGILFNIELVLCKVSEKLKLKFTDKRLKTLDDAAIISKFKNAPEPTTFAHSAYNLDSLGNMRKTEGSRFAGVPRRADADIEICPRSWEKLSSFVRMMQQKGIRVYFANVPYVKTGDLNKEKIQAAANRFNAAVSQLAPVLDSRVQLVFPRSLFLDTDMHLNAEGREIRTKLLLKAICKAETSLSKQDSRKAHKNR